MKMWKRCFLCGQKYFWFNNIKYNIQQQLLMGQKVAKYQIKEGWNQKFQKVEIIQPQSQNLQNSTPQFKVKIFIEHQQPKFQKWKNLYHRLLSYPQIHQYVILPKRIETETCIICSENRSTKHAYFYYDSFGISLHHQIKNKKQEQKYYTEEELWYLLIKLIKIGSFFQSKEMYLGNIHPKNIIFCSNKIKLFSIHSCPNEPTSLQRIKFSKHDDSYIAPEEIQIINPLSPNRKESFLTRNKNKIDLFNIGLTLISAALLKDCYFIYDRNQFQINHQRFHAFQSLFTSQHKRYSQTFIKLILQFLQFQSNKRKTPLFYYSFLSKYQDKILNFQSINDILETQIFPSPLVLNYHQKNSTNTKESKYLTLSKDLNKFKNKIQDENGNQNLSSYCPSKINRKLFS